MEVPTYTEMEYTQHLTSPEWSREETDHLMDLASRFDYRLLFTRFMIIVLLVMDIPTGYYPGYPKATIIFF